MPGYCDGSIVHHGVTLHFLSMSNANERSKTTGNLERYGGARGGMPRTHVMSEGLRGLTAGGPWTTRVRFRLFLP